MRDKILSGILGLCVADALGVPVEFESREDLDADPVVGMRAFGTYNQPAGTWSDDTSLTLCLLDSLANGLDYNDIMDKFLAWYLDAEYTPHGKVFDIGIATRKALTRYREGNPALECGGVTEQDNGNGSLMRILPLAFYLAKSNQEDAIFTVIHNVSALTHRHPRSLVACGIYVLVANALLYEKDLYKAVSTGLERAEGHYKSEFSDELTHYKRLFQKNFGKLQRKSIKSSGYVVDTLEAALWCLLTTGSYKECVLKAVNLGEDTDTVAAVAGGLAGIHYGIESIPEEWLSQIHRLDYIKQLCTDFY